jgi:hypothetical protein
LSTSPNSTAFDLKAKASSSSESISGAAAKMIASRSAVG